MLNKYGLNPHHLFRFYARQQVLAIVILSPFCLPVCHDPVPIQALMR